MENSEWRQNLRAEVAEKERNIMEKKGVIKNPGTRIEMQIQRIQHKGVTVYVYNMVWYAWRINTPLQGQTWNFKIEKIHGLLVLLRLSDHLLPFLLDSFYSPGFPSCPIPCQVSANKIWTKQLSIWESNRRTSDKARPFGLEFGSVPWKSGEWNGNGQILKK